VAKRPGLYVLIIRLDRRVTVTVGRLGTFVFPAGIYAYAGSAMGGLDGRLARHLRSDKRIRWHVDYLLEIASVVGVLEFGGKAVRECGLSSAMLEQGKWSRPVRGFGSSDCACRSHLHFITPDYKDPGEAIEECRCMLGGVFGEAEPIVNLS
jgi:Uri superfamily endonuclease